MSDLNFQQLEVIRDTIFRYEQINDKNSLELKDLFGKDPHLIITPNNKCSENCSHCVAESTPAGITLPYSNFTQIDPAFFKIFPIVDFGRRGNPLIYNSEEHDLADLIKFLHWQGIGKFTLALTLQNKSIPVIDKLEQFVRETNTPIETMITYHHYHLNLDHSKLAHQFNATLKNYLRFSKKIIISLLGDKFGPSPTMKEKVQTAFEADKDLVFSGIVIEPSEERHYHLQLESNKAELYIPTIDTRVYPFGKFKNYLTQRGILEEYTQDLNRSLSDYVCPDLIKWPGIIIEPDGDLNLCASFEAVACSGAVVSNILNKFYSEVQRELIEFHKKETKWFIDNLTDIIAGKISTCKLKNGCYQK